jgi:hypothetical protein
VIQGTAAGRRRSPLEDAYDQFRLERQGNRLSPRPLGSYDYHMDRFFGWLRLISGVIGAERPLSD